jgi:toxin ParE1/3/4
VRLRWTPQAEGDLKDIIDYITQDNPLAAVEVGDEIERQVSLLSDHPAMGRPGRIPNTRELVIAGLPYIVVYRVDEESLTVLRVLHAARRWPKKL